jgi:hypothetical protein
MTLIVIATFIGRLGDVVEPPAAAAAQPTTDESKDAAEAKGKQKTKSPRGPQRPGGAPQSPALKAVTDRNLFSPPPQAVQLTGLLGERAIFSNGRSAGVGDDFGDGKVTGIGPDWIEVEKAGNTRKMWVFGQHSGIGEPKRTPQPVAPPAASKDVNTPPSAIERQ